MVRCGVDLASQRVLHRALNCVLDAAYKLRAHARNFTTATSGRGNKIDFFTFFEKRQLLTNLNTAMCTYFKKRTYIC